MVLTEEQRLLLRRSFIITPAVINFILNGVIAFVTFRGGSSVALWGIDGMSIDIILTSFLLPFLTCLIVMPIIWQLFEQGGQSAVSWTRFDFWWLAWLPQGKWARAAAIGVATALGGSAMLLGGLYLLEVENLRPNEAIVLKASYCAVLAGLVTPLLALASLADVSQYLRETPGKATEAIPIAQLPPGSQKRHVQMMKTDMIGYVEHIARQGNLLRIPLFGPIYGYFINEPELIREVLIKQANAFEKPFNIKYTAKGMRIENLFTADGELWQALRKVMQPAFHARRIDNYAEIMIDYSRQKISDWCDGQRIDAPAEMMDLTLGITTRALFGKDMRGDDAARAIVRFIELFYNRVSGLPIPAWLPTQVNREMRRQIAIIEAWLSPMIAERKAERRSYDDVLSMLIEAQKADTSGLLTDHQVCTEIMNLFAAGYEVVAHTLAFTLYLVSQNPAVNDRIQTELDLVFGREPISLQGVGQLKYLEMVLKESMRLLPVTTVLSRQTAAKVELKSYTLPKRRLVLLSPWVLQRNEAYFPEPLAFQPERFDPENGQEIEKYAYLPFSTGPRICIGNAFAMMQMKINLATIWQHYRLIHAPDHKFEPFYAFNTRPKNGLPMIVHQR
jgi:cytochrome P450